MDESKQINVLERLIKLLPGILLCFVFAALSWPLGRAFPVVGAPVFSILLGILCASVVPKLAACTLFGHIKLNDGIKYTSKKLLQYAIILLGFELNLFRAVEIGRQSLLVMLFTLAAAFLIALVMGKLLRLPGDTVMLIGVGTAICGGSAIAATASVIRAKDEAVARSISTIFLFNIVAVFVFPFLGSLMGMSDAGFGMWAGTAINDTSSVVAAGTSWSNAAGNDTALQMATVVKLTRTLMIVPVCLFLAVYTSCRQTGEAAGKFHFVKVFPWFVVFFVLATVINTFAHIPSEVTKALVFIGKFVIVMAMAGIGLNTNLKSLLSNGFRPILLGLCCWVSVAAASIAAQHILHMV